MTQASDRLAALSPEQRELFELRRRRQQQAAAKIQPVPRSPEVLLPPSLDQERLWFFQQLHPQSDAYNIPNSSFYLHGALDVAALERSLNEIIRRHEILRTNFTTVGGRPVQVINPTLTIPLPVTDLSGLPASECEAEARRLAAEQVHLPFDLAQGALLRASLLRLDEMKHVFLVTTHHIATDWWSLDIFNRELAVLYAAFSAGHASPLPELPVQYADFAAWQRQWLQGKVEEKLLAYWKQQLEGAPLLLELPTDYPRPAVHSSRGTTHPIELSATLSEKLRALGRTHDATLFMTLLAAYNVLLLRYTGQQDIIVGSPSANRNRVEIKNLIGFFLNMLTLRTSLAGDPGFDELLQRVRQMVLEAYAHQDLPFVKIIELLQPKRDLSHMPVIQASFIFLVDEGIFLVDEDQSPELPDLMLEPFNFEPGTSRYDLTLALWDKPQGLTGWFEYSTDLFDAATIGRMSGHLEVLLESIVRDAQQSLSALAMLSEAERHQLLVEWNDTATDYPAHLCIHQLFEAQVERTPDTVALVFGEQQLTYRELNARANQLAHHLIHLGVSPETRVGILVERSAEMVIAVLSVLKAGGAYLPLDPVYPRERIRLVLDDAQVHTLITQHSLAHLLPPSLPPLLFVDDDSFFLSLSALSTRNPRSPVTPLNLAYIIYTSGSTGTPKGAMIPHRSVVNYLIWSLTTFSPHAGQGAPLHSSLSFDLSVTSIYLPLLSGRRLHLLSPLHEVEALAAALQGAPDYSLVKVTPGHLQLLEAQMSESEKAGACRALSVSGEMLTWEMIRRWREAAPQTRIYNEYGATEAAVSSTFYEIREGEREHGGSVPVGGPLANTDTYILSREMEAVAVGVSGEIYIGGVGLGRGYVNRPDLTAERFIPHPYSSSPGARLYRTGDVARYLPDGRIECLGRIDEQVKVRGYRIELGEVEAVLQQHSAVAEGVVVVRGEETEKRLVAYLVAAAEAEINLADIRQHLAEQLPAYMIPAAYVVMDAMPLTKNGKIDKRALPAPELDREQLSQSYVAARTPVEEKLAAIWCEVLGLERVGIHDNFFELGGHSLLATQVRSRLMKAFPVEMPLRGLFANPTVAELAEAIKEEMKARVGVDAPPVNRASREGALPLSFAQQRLWFVDQLEPGNVSFNLPAAVRLLGHLNVGALELTLNEIVRRHEALRTSFGTQHGQPVQVIHEASRLSLPVTDLSHLPVNERDEQVKALAAAEAQRPFDLTTLPLMRATLLRLGEDDHVVLFTMHHIISDGWSIGVLMREISVLYSAFAGGAAESPLPELPLQYADYAIWQRQWLQGETLNQQLTYWKRQLEGMTPLELPTDRPRPAVPSFRGEQLAFELSSELSQSLHQLSREAGATLFMTLLAAFQTLLSRETGREDIVVGANIANRNRKETEDLIGFFVNMLVLRTDLSGDPSFRELLGRVREVALGAYAHQDVPFEKVVEELQIERNLSRNPLFQVVIVLQNAPMGTLELPGLTLEPIALDSVQVPFDLILSMNEGVETLSGALLYNTDLYEASTVERMLQRLVKTLESVARDADQRLSNLQLLTEEETKGFSPEKFSKVKLSRKDFENLIMEISDTA